MIALAVQGVGGDHGVTQVADLVEQRREPGDLVGLAIDVDAGQYHTGGLAQAVITCRAVVPWVREPRRVLPSTATARGVVAAAVVRPASQTLGEPFLIGIRRRLPAVTSAIG